MGCRKSVYFGFVHLYRYQQQQALINNEREDERRNVNNKRSFSDVK